MESIRPEDMEKLGALTRGDFEGRVGDSFPLDGDHDPPLALRLRETRDLAHASDPPGARAPFSALFEGPADRALRQSIHVMVHAELGRLPIFLVPMGVEGDRMLYEAIFR